VVAQLARESGAMVISFATLPFAFEGRRRTAQAVEALARLRDMSDAVICFENDKMGDMVAPKAGIHQAFAAADVTISQSVRSVVNLIQRPGLIRIGFDDLISALRSANGRCLFGYGESDTDNRAHDALTQALKSPLMDRGRLLGDATNVLVQVAGGPGMTLSEVETLMQELGRHINDETQILFGTAVDGRMGNRLAVTLLSSLPADGEPVVPPQRAQPAVAVAPMPPPVWEPAPVTLQEDPAPLAPPLQTILAEIPQQELLPDLPLNETSEPEATEPEPLPIAEVPARLPDPEPMQPRVILPSKKPLPAKEPKAPVEKIAHAKQETLQFESVTRGRFEKSEPTIVEGQDLDVPTFLRKNVRVK
jgi:cell division protein FtsZ